MVPLLALLSVISQPAVRASSDLDLLGEAASASYASTDEARCQGVSAGRAHSVAVRALGPNFQARMAAAADRLKPRFGEEEVEQRTISLLIGHRLTASYCRQVLGSTTRARRALAQLERRLEAH